MNCVVPQASQTTPIDRQWQAHLQLVFALRSNATRLTRNRHQGPLRVQRPFYPEAADCCHVYLLHPPGGLVIGDELTIEASAESGATALMTTPSAGRVYGAKGAQQWQQQTITLQVADTASLEWLPQETIVFDTARAKLHTRVELDGDARYAGWDIVRLGRSASGEKFEQGECLQTLEIIHNQRPLLIERNHIVAGSDLQHAVWGLKQFNTFGTFVLTGEASQEQLDELRLFLDHQAQQRGGYWGVTQKQQMLIIRYLGDDVAGCRAGFEWAWRLLRPICNGLNAVSPRIWAT